MMGDVKRNPSKKRASNFTPREEEVLMKLVHKYIDIIGSAGTDFASSKRKHQYWQIIADEFNGEIGEMVRYPKTLRVKYENIKKRIKKRFAMEMGTDVNLPKKLKLDESQLDSDDFESEFANCGYIEIADVIEEGENDTCDDLLPGSNLSINETVETSENSCNIEPAAPMFNIQLESPTLELKRKALALNKLCANRRNAMISSNISNLAEMAKTVEDKKKKECEQEKSMKLKFMEEKHNEELRLMNLKNEEELKVIREKAELEKTIMREEHLMKMELMKKKLEIELMSLN